MGLEIGSEGWVEDQTRLEQHATAYFRELYSLADAHLLSPSHLSTLDFPDVADSDWASIQKPIEMEEVWQAVKSMGAYKAPGIDGFQPVFYQKCWNVVGRSMKEEVSSFFNTQKLYSGSNDTLISLIAKVGKPDFISQFRPIALCNVSYKIITKVLVRRLQGIIGA